MFCKNCGHDIAPTERHCPFCNKVSGFPEAMTGDSELLVVSQAVDIVGEIAGGSSANRGEAPVPRRQSAAKAADTAVADGYDDNLDAEYDDMTEAAFADGQDEVKTAPVKSADNNAPFSDDSPTTVFSVGEVIGQSGYAAGNRFTDDGYDDGYGDGYDDYDQYDEYDDGYDRRDRKAGTLPLTNQQIMTVGIVTIGVLLIIIVILLFSRCSEDEKLPAYGTSSETSSELVDGNTESQASSQVSSFGESAVTISNPDRSSSRPQINSTPSSSSKASSNISSTPDESPSSNTSTPDESPNSTPSTPETSQSPEDVGEDQGVDPDA